MTGFQRGASTINRKSGLKWGVLEKISTLKMRLYSLANENSQKPTKTNYVFLPLIATAYRWQKDRLERFFAVWGSGSRFVVGLFLLKLLQLFQHLRTLFRSEMSGCKVSSWVRNSALLDCSAENSASNAEKSTAILPFSFIRVRTALLKMSSSSLCWAA